MDIGSCPAGSGSVQLAVARDHGRRGQRGCHPSVIGDLGIAFHYFDADKNQRHPDFLYAALDKTVCAAFSKESR